MQNLFETVASVVKSFVDEEPKPPLHVGEVMSLWTLLAIFQEAYAYYLLAQNTTTDPDLLHVLSKAVERSHADIHSLQQFMIKEGIPLPPSAEPKPKSDPQAIPPGVQLTDDEIANATAAKAATVISICGTSMSESIRTDVGILFFRYQVHLMKFGTLLKDLMRQRGWLKVPPAYIPPGRPHADTNQ